MVGSLVGVIPGAGCRVGLLAAALLAGVGCGREPEPPTPAARQSTGRATPPLKPGDPLPPREAGGWVNGPPPRPDAPGVRLLVVDVWAPWCPYCRLGAPGLSRVYAKYAARGVAFVSLTNVPRDQGEAHAREFSAPWANGYEITAETAAALGAGSGMSGPAAYEIAPTLYLVGPDGRVRWTDSRGRFRHVEPEKWEQDVGAAIEAELAAGPKTRP
jgi:thiol-disulfide isomerase/thioredoxin